MLAAYLSFRIGEIAGLGLAVVVLTMLVVTGVLNYLLWGLVYRPLRSVGSKSTVMLVASLGLMIVLVNMVSLGFGDAPYRPLTTYFHGNLQVLGGRMTTLHILTFVASLLLGLLASCGIGNIPFGAQLRAVSNDDVLSRAMGLNLGLLEIVGGWIGLALATSGVVLSGMDFGLTPSLGFRLLIPAVTASVIGGVNSIKGAFIAGMLVGLLQQACAAMLGVAWQDAILFCILIVIFLVKPTGLWESRFFIRQE